MQEQEIRIVKKYQNRKLYDTKDSCYITLDDIATLIRKGEEVRVVDNKTKNDVTSVILTQILVDQEKSAKSTLPQTMLRDIIRRGKGSVSDFIQRYVVLGAPSTEVKELEAQRYIDQLTTRGDITKIEGKALLKNVLDEEPFQAEFGEQVGKHITKSLRATPKINELESHIKALNEKISSLENKLSQR